MIIHLSVISKQMVLYTLVVKDVSVICVGNELSWTKTRALQTAEEHRIHDRVNGEDGL